MEESTGGFNPQARIDNFNKRMDEINRNEAMRCRGQILGRPGELIPPPSTPQQAWDYQIDAMVAAGFHTKLGMDAETYRNSLPKLPETNPQIAKEFATPVLVDPRIPISDQLKGFDDDISEHGESPNEIANKTYTAQNPYIIWANDGSKYAKASLKELQSKLGPHERPLTFTELLALQRANVELFFQNRSIYHNSGVSISAGSSTTAKGNIPTIYHNYFDLRENGEFQVDAFGNTEYYAHRPDAGWPTCWTESK